MLKALRLTKRLVGIAIAAAVASAGAAVAANASDLVQNGARNVLPDGARAVLQIPSKAVSAGTGTAAEGGSDLAAVPAYEGAASTELNGGIPWFTADDLEKAAKNPGFEEYGEKDGLGRCTAATACVGPETMPAKGEKRGSIGMVKPSGWHTVKYEGIDGKYLYNRCHLIAWCLGAENANERNLVTGTRCMNAEGMLPYEEAVAKYIDRTGNHVLYRATPVFEGDDLVCKGVLIEAQSVEDGGEGVRICAFCHNVQPGIGIDYATGDSWEA